MKILLYKWKAYSDIYLEKNLLSLGHSVDMWQDMGLLGISESAIEKLCMGLQKGYDMVISYNYFEGVAVACNVMNVPYVAWTQDAPLLTLYSKTITFDTNYIFCFDTDQLQLLIDRGIEHAYYLPLGVDCETMGSVAKKGNQEKKYQCDISFLGGLYQGTMLEQTLPKLPDYTRGYLEGIIRMQQVAPFLHYTDLKINGNEKDNLEKIINFQGEGYDNLDFDQLLENLLDRYVSCLDRKKMLEICKSYPGFHLHTNGDGMIYGVKNWGKVDYYAEMPQLFYQSKINLNTSLRSIKRGIPLRVLDIIASGGFVLTNAQPDLFYHFEEGKSIITFQSLDEMKDKIDYYLECDNERIQILEEGKKVVKEQFEIKVLLEKIFSAVF